MDELIRIIIGIVLAVLAAWIVLLIGLWLMRPGSGSSGSNVLNESVRLLPDLVRLVLRLAKDPTLPRGVRIWLGALAVYLAIPIDLVPDFIPILGYADDVIAILWVLRKVIRTASTEAVERHWPGTSAGLETLLQVTRARPTPQADQ